MSRAAKIGLGIGLGTIVFIGIIITYLISAKFTAERYEQTVYAQDEQMQNVWGMMQNNLEMQGFTVDKYGKDFINSIKANAIRYENDRGSMMKWVQESSSQMSPDIHKKFMVAIEKAYAKKEAAQKTKIAMVQEYRTYLNASLKGTISKIVFSYPTAKAQEIMDRIIKTKKVTQTWETGNDEVSNPFAK